MFPFCYNRIRMLINTHYKDKWPKVCHEQPEAGALGLMVEQLVTGLIKKPWMDTRYYTTYQIDTTMVTDSLLIITEGENIHCIGVADIKLYVTFYRGSSSSFHRHYGPRREPQRLYWRDCKVLV
ncbi:hypothetical protein CHARACLAT_033457 [Characodon lateralis]|uniref:Uncharacterized protein n=1 Tax=Characodon lateralis TaxID=208331 RepID=A0ABU7EYX8_9TELE|nr:hypothetical protein [Characodon lateralis]